MSRRHESTTAGLAIARRAVCGYFFINGVVFASWVARIPEIKHRLALNDGTLGIVLFMAAAGTVLGLLGVGRLVARYGSTRVCGYAAPAVPLSLMGPGLAPNLPTLMAALLLLGVLGGINNVAMNTRAIELERAFGRPILTSFHAVYSMGGLLGAGLGALAVRLGLTPAVSFLAIGGALAVAAWACGLPGGPVVSASPPPPATRSGRIGTPGARILILGACCCACLLSEGAISDWSSVYLRDNLAIAPSLAPSGFMVFSVAMALGRTAGDTLAARLGSARLVGCCAVVSCVGVVAGLTSQDWRGALAGLGVLGLGLSCISPQMFKLAGEQASVQTGTAVAAVATLGYLGLLSGPGVVGGLAQLVGLPQALGLAVTSVMLGVALASRAMSGWGRGVVRADVPPVSHVVS